MNSIRIQTVVDLPDGDGDDLILTVTYERNGPETYDTEHGGPHVVIGSIMEGDSDRTEELHDRVLTHIREDRAWQ